MEDARAYEELRVGFTAAVSHELRTPLARLLALLESASLPDADNEPLLAQAREQVEEMSELVDDVLFLSELESGREVVALGSTAALPVLEDIRDRLADSAERADVAIRIEADADVELPLRRRMLQIVVENLWDSGKVVSDQSVHVEYRGATLKSRQRGDWKVRAWDTDGQPGDWSETAWWEMGLLDEDEWHGHWIGATTDTRYHPAPFFRRSFFLNKTIESARLVICGLGYYELHCNGKRIC